MVVQNFIGMATRGASIVAIIASGVCASSASAQTINDGDSVYTLSLTNTTGAATRTGTLGNFGSVFRAGGDTTNQLFQHWWWYRVDGVTTREFALSNRTAFNAVGNLLTADFVEPEGLNFRVIYRLTDGSNTPASANLEAGLEITNTTAGPLTIAVFGYHDYDLEGIGTDVATQVGPNRIGIRDTATNFTGEFFGIAPTAFQAGLFPNVRNLLTDTDIDNLNNSGLPTASGDYASAFQWNLTIPAGGTETIRSAFSLNMTAFVSSTAPACDSLDFNGNGVFPEDADIIDFFNVLAGAACPTGTCNDLDFNNNNVFPEDADIIDFLNTLAGAPCP